ncbi:arylsulfatase B-like [Onthophagus taurus]|uniref:arylsulfatase B-like n=1 Tax=Onthophagus taurus TaxID=166361 RepID=UPI000C209FD3|nr:arylsulfatase B-like [Onthophagus taurus]
MWLRLFCVICLSTYVSTQSTKPNIVVILADDMGWDDIGFHGNNEIPTPNIDALAYNGVILNSHYTQALCTPSRSAFLTGKYPIHLGMQHLVILEPEPWGLPLNETLLPEHLKRNGYKTHAVGKWHLGFHKKEFTPTYRGFDTHYGYWQGFHDYYEHTIRATYSNETGYDMRRNMSVDWDAKGKYSTTLFTEEAVKIIKEHDTTDPLFMYFAHLAPHAANDWEPLQAPDEEIAKFSYIENPNRRIYAAMVSEMDKSVGEVVTALRKKRMLENTIILFMSDNGGATIGIHSNTGSNYPLRGMKNSPFEGAMRCLAAIWSPLIKQPKRVMNDLIHISDWLPTFYSAIGLNQTELGVIDGVDMWDAISDGKEGKRSEVLYNIDDVWKYGAIRKGPWKYLYGSVSKKDSWYGAPVNSSYYNTYSIEDVMNSKAGVSISGTFTHQQIHENIFGKLLGKEEALELRKNATLNCTHKKGNVCNPSKSPCLFNLDIDPCETNNLIKENPKIANELLKSLEQYRKTALPLINIPRDPNADPALYNGTWVNWKDYVDVTIIKKEVTFNELSPLALVFIVASCILVIIAIAILVIISLTRDRRDRKGKYHDVQTSLNGTD